MKQLKLDRMTKFAFTLLFIIVTGCKAHVSVEQLRYYVDTDQGSEKADSNELCILLNQYGFVEDGCDGSELKIKQFEKEELTSNKIIAARNELQHAILLSSTIMCTEFKSKLQRISRRNLLSIESMTILLPAGAAFGGSEKLVKGLATLAGVSSAYAKLLGEKYFNQNDTALQGIELARARILEEIIEEKNSNLLEYPINRAINDALRYHSVCNVADGRFEVSRSNNDRLENSIDEILRSIDQQNNSQQTGFVPIDSQ